MMKLTQSLSAGIALLLSFTANADVYLEDNSRILGKWNQYAEAASLHKEKVDLNAVWEFTKDGIIHAKAEDRTGRTKTLRIDLKYSIEDGVIRKEKSPGRSRLETCKVVSLDEKNMTLKCPFLYFFFKR